MDGVRACPRVLPSARRAAFRIRHMLRFVPVSLAGRTKSTLVVRPRFRYQCTPARWNVLSCVLLANSDLIKY